MANISYSTDSTTLTLNGYVFTNFIVGDFIEVAPVNETTSRTDSADGVSISQRSDKDVHNITVRVQRNSQDDIFLNSARSSNDVIVLAGSLKENFNTDGTEGLDSWTLEGGSVTTAPTSTRNNQEVNAVHEYVIQFRFATRAI